MTTGPLGAGFAMGVGMAVAERFLAEHFNQPGHAIVDHYTYGIVSDGDLMEGVSAEAASLVGTLRLGKLIYLYDDNEISIEGSTDIAFTEQVGRRFEAYGWHVERVDGNDVEAVAATIERARSETGRPSLIMAAFHVPDEALAEFRKAVPRGRHWEDEWDERFSAYTRVHATEAELWQTLSAGELPEGWDNGVPSFTSRDGALATRQASGQVLNGLIQGLPSLVGGSADLAPSTNTYLQGYGDFGFDEWCGHNMHFGVREHAMGNIVNGMALHGGVLPYAATFLIFSDYMRPALRLAALQQAHVVFLFTHDSIGLGEDGPTHQPIEHLASLRAISGLTVFRPADANETAACWRLAVQRPGPSVLALTRQSLPILDDDARLRDGVAHGAYVLADAPGAQPDVALLATGSEVAVALAARALLAERGVQARVVSMPSWEVFEEQSSPYRDEVLPRNMRARVAVEAAAPMGWHRYVGDLGEIIALDHFGASAPAAELFAAYGLTAEAVATRAAALVQQLATTES